LRKADYHCSFSPKSKNDLSACCPARVHALAAGVFTALFAIMMTTQLIRLLGDAAQGRVEPDAVVALLGFSSLNYLPVLLSLSSFVAILLALSRSYRDSEMVVWFSSGLSLMAWIRPVLVFVMPLVLTISVLSLFLSPWALSQSAEFRGKLSSRHDAGQISSGIFQESSAGERVVFVEGIADDTSNVFNVFVNEAAAGAFGRDDGRLRVSGGGRKR
jgi:lipopolysaccharide export system permease protein